MNKKKKILFVLKARNIAYGKSFGLVNSCNFVANALNNNGVEAKIVEVIDGNGIDKEVYNFRPDIVIIEAYFATPEKIEELISLPRYKDIFWTIRSHSEIPFFANESICIEWTKKYWELTKEHDNLSISSNTMDFVEQIKDSLNIKIDYLPNIYCPNKNIKYDLSFKDDNTLHVGLFGALRPLKNHLIQALAAISFANLNNKTLHLHINATRLEQRAEPVLKNLEALFQGTKHKLIKHDWLSYEETIKLVRKMDFTMQVSLSESFNLVAADSVWNNVPVVGSYEIEWLNFLYKAKPTKLNSILLKMFIAYYGQFIGLQYLNLLNLKIHNRFALTNWLDWINVRSCRK